MAFNLHQALPQNTPPLGFCSMKRPNVVLLPFSFHNTAWTQLATLRTTQDISQFCRCHSSCKKASKWMGLVWCCPSQCPLGPPHRSAQSPAMLLMVSTHLSPPPPPSASHACFLVCMSIQGQSTSQVQCQIEETCLAVHACASACLLMAPRLGLPADVFTLAHAFHNMHMSHACTTCMWTCIWSPWAGRCAARTRLSPLGSSHSNMPEQLRVFLFQQSSPAQLSQMHEHFPLGQPTVPHPEGLLQSMPKDMFFPFPVFLSTSAARHGCSSATCKHCSGLYTLTAYNHVHLCRQCTYQAPNNGKHSRKSCRLFPAPSAPGIQPV